ncbi:hypothetical protein Pla110_24690 [Polystyrenella longa]|uniref:Uncharacterized protein n=1 Tax=Polystyrenella longa TaxID=2528007 RepID=A0A518CND2_9PLAN|nr:hypothetical protein [Polystyrenella longa]QDU80736.1 hypothetical protein Pla110_24690 [Polystyrenella longa]
MKKQNSNQAAWQQLAASSGFNGLPPKGPSLTSSEPPASKPTLTQTFNASSKQSTESSNLVQPVTKKQIEALRKEMSQPKPTLEMSPLGNINGARDPEADRKIMQTINALTEQLGKKKGLKDQFALADKKSQLKTSFNQAANDRGM